jgi:hypothetical protein
VPLSSRPSSVLLDSNLLLLLLVGSADRAFISKARKLQSFVPEDFDLLADILESFRTIVTTPHILTEVSNLLGKERDDIRSAAREAMAELVTKSREEREPAINVVADSAFLRLGMADAAIAIAASVPAFVLTTDAPLYLHLSSNGAAAANFNHLRESGWS